MKGKLNKYKSKLTGKLEYIPPNQDVQKFEGTLKLTKDPQTKGLSFENFIPRGSVLRSEGWIYGLVVYTGMDTKIMMNSQFSRMKTSYLDIIN
jgi:magnesium-transporting ATPase (P-type)